MISKSVSSQRCADCAAIRDTAMRASMRSTRNPQVRRAPRIQVSVPAACQVAATVQVAKASVATQIAGVIGFRAGGSRVEAPPRPAPGVPAGSSAATARCWGASRWPARPPSAPHGDDPRGEVAVASAARVEKPGQVAWRVVAHHQLDLVAALAQRLGLVLGVAQRRRPGRTNENGTMIPIFTRKAAASAGTRRATPSSSTESETAREIRA